MMDKVVAKAVLIAFVLISIASEVRSNSDRFHGLDVFLSVGSSDMIGVDEPKHLEDRRMKKKRKKSGSKMREELDEAKMARPTPVGEGMGKVKTESEVESLSKGSMKDDQGIDTMTVDDEIDEWYLAFTNSSLGNHTSILDGIVLEYYVAKNKTGQLVSSIYDESCLNKIDSPSVTVNSVIIEEQAGMDYDAGAVSIDIDTVTMENSTFWDEDSETTGVIGFCVKSELMLGNMSVSFSDTVVHADVDFEAGFASFEIDDIKLLKFNATEITETSQMEATACVCDDSNVCDDDPILSQNSPFNICITPIGDDMVVAEIESVDIYQDDLDKFMPVTNGVPSSSLASLSTGPIGVVETRMVSVFFDTADPSDITITGQVVLDFAAERSLSEKGDRALNGKNQKAAFQCKAGLDNTPIPTTINMDMTTVLGAVIVLQVFVVIFLLKRRKKSASYAVVEVDEEADK